jgi:hypothetical protein
MLGRLRIFLVPVVTLILTSAVSATTINFETFAGGTGLGPVLVGGNTVTFATGAGATPGATTGYVVEVGGPVTGFQPLDSPAGGLGGARFLTDELAGPGLPNQALNYFLSFAVPIMNLSLDLYDFRDGGAVAGDTATLTLFSDAFTTPVASALFVIPAILPPDGNVVNLAAATGVFNVFSASLVFSGPDLGTGIDNVSFTSAPEPWSILLLGSGMLGMGGALRRRHAKLGAARQVS